MPAHIEFIGRQWVVSSSNPVNDGRCSDAQVLEGATAVGLACLICQLGSLGAKGLGLPGAVIPVVTGRPWQVPEVCRLLHVFFLFA